LVYNVKGYKKSKTLITKRKKKLHTPVFTRENISPMAGRSNTGLSGWERDMHGHLSVAQPPGRKTTCVAKDFVFLETV
jgi:hypothetical protein